jgi:hypothetical protein
MRKPSKKLALTVETIRRLQHQELGAVAGGVTVQGCGPTQRPFTACDPAPTFQQGCSFNGC